MGYDYEISYRKGKENVVADGLSRLPAAQLLAISTSTINADLLAKVKQSWENDESLQAIITKLKNGEVAPHYSFTQELLYRKGRVAVGKDPDLQVQIIQFFHASSFGGHSGVAVTIKRITSFFWWKGVSRDVRNFIKECLICQQYKADISTPRGLLQPLPIPGAI